MAMENNKIICKVRKSTRKGAFILNQSLIRRNSKSIKELLHREHKNYGIRASTFFTLNRSIDLINDRNCEEAGDIRSQIKKYHNKYGKMWMKGVSLKQKYSWIVQDAQLSVKTQKNEKPERSVIENECYDDEKELLKEAREIFSHFRVNCLLKTMAEELLGVYSVKLLLQLGILIDDKAQFSENQTVSLSVTSP